MNRCFTMTTLMTVLMCLCFPIAGWAQQVLITVDGAVVTIDGVVYEVDSLVYCNCGYDDSFYYDGEYAATVVACDKTKQGDLVILDSIAYNGENIPVVLVESYTFKECNGLTSITIPKGVRVSEKAFSGCSNLRSVTMPSFLHYRILYNQEVQLFENCPNITSLMFQEGSTYASAFGLTGLKLVSIPEGVEEVGYFNNCSSLDSVVIPESVKEIGSFQDCSGMTSFVCLASMKEIGMSTFNGCSRLKSIVLPASLKTIGRDAFRDCSSLVSIDVPEGVTTIDDDAFYGCRSLISIELPSSVKKIGSFANCKSLKSIEIPQGVTEIGSFADCSSLASIELPSSVKKIGSFANCKSLRSIEIPQRVTEIVSFAGCSSLTSIEIPSSVKKIGARAFVGCIGLTSVTMPSYLQFKIFDNTDNAFFINCPNVTSLTFQEGSTYASAHGLTNLTSVSIPESVAYIGSFTNCKNLTSIDIPSGAIKIYANAFYGCSNLKSITIPDGVTEIESGILHHCSSIDSITIPDGVTSIGKYAFRLCSNLKTLYSKSVEPPYLDMPGVFYGVHPDMVVYVPKGAKAAYESATGWNDLTIKEYDYSDVALPSITLPFTAYVISGGVVLSSVEGEVEVAVYNLQGVVLYRDMVSVGETVVSLPSGNYVVRADSGQGTLVIIP